MRIAYGVSIILICLSVNSVNAQGLATWLGDRVGLGGVGRAIDKGHDQIKQAVPPYKQLEEGASGAVRHGFGELAGEAGGPALAQLIQASRSDTINAGVQPIPPNIRANLSGFFPDELLNSVTFRVGLGNDLLLASNAFRYGDAVAITLVDVIMFKDANQAYNDLALWAHELGHVEQYRRWGLLDFAKRYAKDSNGVENEANARANSYVSWYNGRFQQGQFTPFNNQSTNICSTPYGRCGTAAPMQYGTPCGCPSQWGWLYGMAAN
ncbi:eCIS core domain-containing protein [Methylobacterium fujisawaense]|uniref:eCIS core domain-containing protein n=1 Tax=Methylobacterium fujisawaense TaxID=107400 RepID=UPI00244733B0|nr:DUF4157 domain-containing protein [Methylobacterium fujisawaense]MDH3030154.1 DUF4157 domain-containing protein [Methylobacterium fujisawaense]